MLDEIIKRESSAQNYEIWDEYDNAFYEERDKQPYLVRTHVKAWLLPKNVLVIEYEATAVIGDTYMVQKPPVQDPFVIMLEGGATKAEATRKVIAIADEWVRRVRVWAEGEKVSFRRPTSEELKAKYASA